jgi:hypothetical protein
MMAFPVGEQMANEGWFGLFNDTLLTALVT